MKKNLGFWDLSWQLKSTFICGGVAYTAVGVICLNFVSSHHDAFMKAMFMLLFLFLIYNAYRLGCLCRDSIANMQKNAEFEKMMNEENENE